MAISGSVCKRGDTTVFYSIFTRICWNCYKLSNTWHLLFTARSRSTNISAHCTWYQSRQGKRNQTLDGTALYSHREETELDQLQHWTLVANGQWITPSSWHRTIGLHATLLYLRMKDPLPSPQKTDIVVGSARCCMIQTKHNQEVNIESETGEIFLHKLRLWGLVISW